MAIEGEQAGAILNHLQKAVSEAQAIESPEVRRAIESLAAATRELVAALRDG